MSRLSGLTSRLRRYLADRLARLQVTLADLGRRLRATLASRIADYVTGVVRDVVEAALAEPAHEPRPPRLRYRYLSPSWSDSDDEASPYQPRAQENLFGGYPRDPDEDEADEPEPMPAVPQDSRTPPCLPAALAVGLQAGAFCLRRRGAGSVWTALGVGLSASLVAFFGGAFLADCAVTLGSVLALAG
jgi:hypothetical protein